MGKGNEDEVSAEGRSFASRTNLHVINDLQLAKLEMDNMEFKEYKVWALVTGAASGMGRIYAQRLAQMGYNLVLIDINEANLSETERMVKGENTTDLKVLSLVQDLSVKEAADIIYEKVSAAGCEVEVLVNNAGIMYCQAIHATSERALSLIMMVHMYTPLMICRKFINGMRERGCGYILNISSLASWMIWPGIGMYGATKRFVRDYSRELRIECQKTGVSITNAYFGAVDTPLIPLKDSLRKLARNLAVMISPEKAVDKALQATFKRRKGVMPGLLNKIFKPICMLMPDFLLGWIYRKAAPYLMKV